MTSTVGVPTQLGHVALRVRDLDRAVAFYRDVVGLPLRAQHGSAVAFLGIRADASHEVALFALGADAPGPEPNRVGMYHMAWEMASFEDLQAFHARLLTSGANITGYSDRQCNVMFLDPDGNENEALWEPAETPDPLPRLIS
ncbi:MAG: VOC family protein [Chloroflexi bacterium]|nr:VOC family protein [Chloroflexota bacterium]MBV9131157.1 VOC family protein [Chloroflexota bacterium]MBV9892660.1 VOC family protein [Chloroflexota bacterium]